MVIDLYSCYVNNFSVAMEELEALQSTKAALAAFLSVRFDHMNYEDRKKVGNSSNRLFARPLQVISFTTVKMVPRQARAMEKTTNLIIIFLYFVDI